MIRDNRPIIHNGKEYQVRNIRPAGPNMFACDAYEILPNGQTRVVVGLIGLDALARAALRERMRKE